MYQTDLEKGKKRNDMKCAKKNRSNAKGIVGTCTTGVVYRWF